MSLAVGLNERAKQSAVLAMARGFRRYGPEEERAVRTIKVQGDELSYLRQRREMLRSMTPEQALQVIEFHNGLNVFQAFDLAKRTGKLIVPNDVIDRILTETDKRVVTLTGTAAIYEAPGMPFGDTVTYAWKTGADVQYSFTFDVPRQFRGRTDCTLVVEHPDFELVPVPSGNNSFELKAAEGSVSLLKRFPKGTRQWYECNERFGIPVGNPKKAGVSTRYFWRQNNGYISLVTRGYGYYGDYEVRRGVGLDGAPSNGLGVALF
ncbi:MAG: hypothetical protein PHF60_03105 [Candidatus ainarchaeum sp.]|nr:hypothetical protein [Candidatus ainarchaeum sp.]